MKYVVFMCAQLKFQTDLGRENSASCYRQGNLLMGASLLALAKPIYFLEVEMKRKSNSWDVRTF